MAATHLIRSEKRDMVLFLGLVLVVDRRRRTWTEMGMSAVRDTKSMDAIDCCSVVTCPTDTLESRDPSSRRRRGYRGGFAIKGE